MDWLILGISPTKDKKVITDAYRSKLRQTNPEDKPEEFKALRAAYEEALALADQADTAPVRDESPVGLWMEEITRLYGDYAARIDPARWEALMANDVCTALDTRPAAEEALLRFLMEHYYLPKAVWQVLDRVFRFSQRAEALYETWPREFIDHAVLSGLRYEPALDYALFIPGVNGEACDTYRQLYFQANQSSPEEAQSLFAQMDALPERHPYGDALRHRFCLQTERAPEAKDGLRQLAQAYPDDAHLVILWAELCLDDGDAAAAQQLASHILQLEPNHVGAKVTYAKSLAAQKQYHEAKECAYEIYRVAGEDHILLEQVIQLMQTWNGELIRQREAAHRQDPADINNIIELAWCYSQNDRIDDALALAHTIDPDYEDAFAYHNLMGKLYHNAGKFAEALPHLQLVETILQDLTDDGTPETQKRLQRLPELLQVQGNCLAQLDRPAEAKEKFRQALALAPEDVQTLSMMGKILFALGDYAYAVDILSRLLQLSPGASVAALLISISLYRLHRDREAFDAINRALDAHGNELTLFMLKMQILIRNGAYEETREILAFLEENNAPEDIATDFIRAQLTDFQENDPQKALRQYRALQKRVEAGEHLLLGAELYHRLAILTANGLDLRQEKHRSTILELADQGLAYDRQNADLLSLKARVLQKGGLLEEAIAMYKALAEKDTGSETALRGLAELYYDDLNLHAAQALGCYEALLEKQKTAELYFYAATCKRQLGDMAGARAYYLKELEMDPEDIDAFHGLALLSDNLGDYEGSLKLLEQGLAIMKEYDRCFDPMVAHKLKVLRRMERFEEAFAFAAEAADQYHFTDTFQQQFDICCQAGWWDRAAQLLEQWKLHDRTDPARMAAAGRLHLLQGKLFKAAVAMGPAKHKLPYRQIQDFRLELAELEQNHARQLQLLSLRILADPNDDHALSLQALAYWRQGKQQAAKGAALQALKLLDEILEQSLTDEPLYRGRRCLMLAILGRHDEARAELALTRTLPLCHFCEYGSCKDADIYEAQIEEILGNTEKARQLYDAGRAKWPDDLDFLSGQLRMKKKGRK